MDDDSNPKPDRPGDSWIAEYEAASAARAVDAPVSDRERSPPAPQPEPTPASRDAFRFYKLAAQADVAGPAKAVLWVLAHHADYRSGRCFLHNATIVHESGFSRRTVQRSIGELAELGIIRVSPGTKRHNREQGANVYLLRTGAPE